MRPETELTVLCRKLSIRVIAAEDPAAEPADDATNDERTWHRNARHWRVKLVRTVNGKRRELSTPFSQGSAHVKPPTAADVLSCLLMDARAAGSTFEDWCADLGYDSDSRKAERVWDACRKIAPKVQAFCGDDLSALERAEH